jgi:hypothetical protein
VVDSPTQHALTALFPVLGGQADTLARALEGGAAALAFSLERVSTLHFARFLVLPPDAEASREGAAFLVLATTFDGELDAHLAELWSAIGPILDRWLASCEGWRSPGTEREFERYVRGCLTPAAALYCAHPGLSVERILADARLREAFGGLLDARAEDLAALGAEQIVDWVRASLVAKDTGRDLWFEPTTSELVRSKRSVARVLALHGPKLAWTCARSLVHEVAEWVLALWHDVMPGRASTPGRRAPEPTPRGIERALSQVVCVKPGRFRRAALRLMLRVTHELAQTASAATAARAIHAARFVLLPDGRLVLLCDYSGSLAACIGALVDRAGGWLGLLFSQTRRFPFTFGWVLGGARNEARFRAWLADGELPTPVTYCAYPLLSAAEIAENGEIRELLTGALDDAGARRLLSLIRD